MTGAATLDLGLLAFGGPHSADELPAFLQAMTGVAPDAATVAAIWERYEAIGGGSPLRGITQRQAAALQAEMRTRLGRQVRVRAGFLFAEPTVADCLDGLQSGHVAALPMSPLASALTAGAYRSALDAAGARHVPLIGGWHADPRYLAAWGCRVAEALDGSDAADFAVVFTAHSLPLRAVCGGDDYVGQFQETVSRLVGGISPGDWRMAFQSRGRRGEEWLGPDVADAVGELAEAGWKKLLVVPVGFVADHVETLYDLDVVLRELVENLGMTYRRAQALNDSPRFIEALAGVVADFVAGDEVGEPGVDAGTAPAPPGRG